MSTRYMNPYLAGCPAGPGAPVATIFITGRGLGASGAVKSAVIAAVDDGRARPRGARRPSTASTRPSTPATRSSSGSCSRCSASLIGGFLSGLVSDRLAWITEKGPRIAGAHAPRVRARRRRALRHRRAVRPRLHERRGPQRHGGARPRRLPHHDRHLRHRLRRRVLLPQALDLTWRPSSRTSLSNELNILSPCSSASPSASSSSRPASRRRAAWPASSTATTSRCCASSSPRRHGHGGHAAARLRWACSTSTSSTSTRPSSWPAVVGGVIMGVGFVLGGYCPGTSVCAAAIGKKDAIVFVLGGFLGVLALRRGLPGLRGLRERRRPRPGQGLRLARRLAGPFCLPAVAGARRLRATSWIEKKVSRRAVRSFPVRPHRLAAPARSRSASCSVPAGPQGPPPRGGGEPRYQRAHPVRFMTPTSWPSGSSTATRASSSSTCGPRTLQAPAAPRFRQPAARGDVRPGVGALARSAPRHARVRRRGRLARARAAALLAERLGYEDVRVLRGGLAGCAAPSSTPPSPPLLTAADVDAERFRAQARAELPKLIAEARGQSSRPKPVVKTVKGGCS